jgi:hypothetical protein
MKRKDLELKMADQEIEKSMRNMSLSVDEVRELEGDFRLIDA